MDVVNKQHPEFVKNSLENKNLGKKYTNHHTSYQDPPLHLQRSNREAKISRIKEPSFVFAYQCLHARRPPVKQRVMFLLMLATSALFS